MTPPSCQSSCAKIRGKPAVSKSRHAAVFPTRGRYANVLVNLLRRMDGYSEESNRTNLGRVRAEVRLDPQANARNALELDEVERRDAVRLQVLRAELEALRRLEVFSIFEA
eukprot:scaffold2044_cov247-Pinguiococcus_pyrenoidosus.AAC.8